MAKDDPDKIQGAARGQERHRQRSGEFNCNPAMPSGRAQRQVTTGSFAPAPRRAADDQPKRSRRRPVAQPGAAAEGQHQQRRKSQPATAWVTGAPMTGKTNAWPAKCRNTTRRWSRGRRACGRWQAGCGAQGDMVRCSGQRQTAHFHATRPPRACRGPLANCGRARAHRAGRYADDAFEGAAEGGFGVVAQASGGDGDAHALLLDPAPGLEHLHLAT